MDNGNTGNFLKGLMIGGLVGSIAAILYAPKSGRETREDISKRTDEFMTKAKEEYDSALERSKQSYDSAIQRLRELEDVARKKVDEVEEQVRQLTEKGRETVEESRGRFKKAFDAGVDTYKSEKETKSKKS